MNKNLFYKMALRGGAYIRKEWVISAFSVVRTVADAAAKPYQIRYNRESTEVYVPAAEGTGFDWVMISDHPPMTALFMAQQPLKVEPADIINLAAPVDSTYGDLLFNYIALVHPFGKRIPYQVGPIKIRKIEAMIAERLVDNPMGDSVALATTDSAIQTGDSAVAPEDAIPVSMYMEFGKCMGAIAGYTQLFVPSITPKALQTDPRVMVRRAELLEQYKDRLWDPVIQAKIQDELIAMDINWIKGDPSEGFFIGKKSFGTARKRMFLIHGPEAGFNEGGNATLVVNSLNEGWDTTKLPDMFNSTRAGSFYRGALTALGGEAVKFFMLVFQNTNISEDDCGAKLGRKRYIDPADLEYYTGLWQILDDGSLRILDKATLPSVSGKTITVRSPQFCKTKLSDYCAKCAGQRLANNPFGVAAENTSVASMFMSVMMASAHAKELKTAPLDFRNAFR